MFNKSTAQVLNAYLENIHNEGFTSNTLRANKQLYNDAAERIFDYCLERTSKYKYFLSAMDAEPAEIAGMITMRILDRFDTLWSCTAPNPAGLASVSATNAIRDIGRSHKRRSAHFHPISFEDLLEDVLIENAIPPSAEEYCIQALEQIEEHELVMYAIAQLHKRTLFETVCFLSTRVLVEPHVTPKLLASQLDRYGLNRVSGYYFPLLAKALGIPASKLNCTYRNTDMPTYVTLQQLRAKISSASQVCKLALMKDTSSKFKAL